MKKIVILIISIFILCACSNTEVRQTMPKEAFINFKEDNIDVYKEITLKDLVDATNVDIENIVLNTNEIGSREIEFYYHFNNKKYSGKVRVNIVDREEPKIFGGSNKTVTKGYTGDICNLFMYADNYDTEPLCVVQGDYDLNKVGTYNLNVVVTDNSGNSTNHVLTLNVINKTNNNNNTYTSTPYAFSEAIKKYKTEDTYLGIDVSEWQGDVDYEKVVASGAEFVMIRIGYTSKDISKVDGQFYSNIKKAKDAGLKVGVYYYSKALSKEEAKREANWVIETLDKEKLDLPIVFDWEIWSNWNTYHLSFHNLNDIAKTFIKTVEKSGYDGALYGSKFYLESFWDNSYDNVWLAHYTSTTNYEGNYFMWQFSNCGRIDGINGDVDMNVMYRR